MLYIRRRYCRTQKRMTSLKKGAHVTQIPNQMFGASLHQFRRIEGEVLPAMCELVLHRVLHRRIKNKIQQQK